MAGSYNKTYNLILTALFCALSAVGAFIKIPMVPAPITLQILFVLLAGLILGPWYGMLSQLLYVALGLFGLPIFTGGGGFSYVLNPTFGYLLGFIAAPVFIGLAMRLREQRQKPATFPALLVICAFAVLIIYAVGTPYMYMILNHVAGAPISFKAALVSGFIIFIPGDAIKCVIVSMLAKRLLPAVSRPR